MENFGCEFLDDGCFGAPTKPEPWDESATFVGLSLIKRCADKRYLADIRGRNRERIANLRTSISVIGVQVPLVLLVDAKSVYLSDGNHRLLAAEGLGFKRLPVEIRTASYIRAQGLRLQEFMIEFLRSDFAE